MDRNFARAMCLFLPNSRARHPYPLTRNPPTPFCLFKVTSYSVKVRKSPACKRPSSNLEADIDFLFFFFFFFRVTALSQGWWCPELIIMCFFPYQKGFPRQSGKPGNKKQVSQGLTCRPVFNAQVAQTPRFHPAAKSPG